MVDQEKNKFSVTSNNIKLLKHLDTLQDLQEGKSSPIMAHVMLTNQCNIACSTCCFSSTNNDGNMLDFDVFKEAMSQFRGLGTSAVELTGGGDPTMYPKVNDAVNYLSELGFTIGINTNGLRADKIKTWDKVLWTRLSMNTLDFYSTEKAHKLAHIRSFTPTPDITACYVWNEKGPQNIDRVIDYANNQQLITRVVPNCIVPKDEIVKQLDDIITAIDKHSDNNYVFASDHNLDIQDRRNQNCYAHHIKPALFTDGFVYSCPSSELSPENGVTLNPLFRICHGTEIEETYNNMTSDPTTRPCNYCKYKQQNELLEDILMPTTHNEFC